MEEERVLRGCVEGAELRAPQPEIPNPDADLEPNIRAL